MEDRFFGNPEMFLKTRCDRIPDESDVVAQIYARAHECLWIPSAESRAVALLTARYRFRTTNIMQFMLDKRLAANGALAARVLVLLGDSSIPVGPLDENEWSSSAAIDYDAVDVFANGSTGNWAGSVLGYEIEKLREGCVPIRVPDLDDYYRKLGPERQARLEGIMTEEDEAERILSLVFKPTTHTIKYVNMESHVASWPLGVLQELDSQSTSHPSSGVESAEVWDQLMESFDEESLENL